MKIPKDEQDLRALLRKVARDAAEEVLLQTGQIKTTMNISEAYRRSTRSAVDKAVELGRLKCTTKGRSRLIQRADFNDWHLTNEWI